VASLACRYHYPTIKRLI